MVMQDAATRGLEVYVVGGAVRDRLLGLPAGDRDWVVVGATPEELVERGFTLVGGDFPVFLHPLTREEYALARTERKTSRGYQGFTFYTGPEVTLADDLCRRDLTVNAIAQDAAGALCDPLGGVQDVQARVFRHVGTAFTEDPVRILRLARFAARFEDFSVAPGTLDLCKQMVESGEVDALVAERVWKELSRGLMAHRPSRMFDVLRACGALKRSAPDLNDDPELGARVDRSAQAELPLPARYALLCLASPQRDVLSRHWRVPVACADYARLLPGFLQSLQAMVGVDGGSDADGNAEAGADADADADADANALHSAVVDMLERGDARRQPERFLMLVKTAALMVQGGVDLSRWGARVQAIVELDAGAIARACQGDPARIKPALRKARLKAIRSI